MSVEFFDQSERYVGRDIGGVELELTPARVAYYVGGTGDDNSWYRTQSPLGAALAPAFLLYSEAARFKEGRRYKWLLHNVYRTLMARQEWEIFAPLKLGELVRTRAFIADRYIKREREYVVLELLFFNHEDSLAARTRLHQSFVIQGEAALAQGLKPEGRDKDDSPAPRATSGELIHAPLRTVTAEMSALISGRDPNVHTNPEISNKVGFTDLNVQGSLAVCLIGELMTRRFGLGFYYGGRADVKLTRVLRVGESVRARGLIIQRRREGKHRRAEVEVWCEKSDGTTIAIGTASALEP